MESTLRAVRATAHGLELEWSDGGGPAGVSWFWLRDHCRAPACLHPETRQRQRGVLEVPANIPVARVTLCADRRGIEIRWADDHGHLSRFSAEFLRSVGPASEEPLGDPGRRRLWIAATIGRALPEVDYDSVMADDPAGLLYWLDTVDKFGFCLVRGAAATPEATRALAKRIGYIRETIFGGLWDFTANLAHGDSAYTNLELGPHTDGTYSRDAPGLQMLHCLHFDGVGGESVLVDGFKAAEELRRSDQHAFEVLTRIKVPGQYIEPGIHLRAEHPILALDDRGAVVRVSFNNYDRAPFLLPEPDMTDFYDALRAFARLVEHPAAQLRFQLTPGRVLLFDNWRLLHGRGAYRGHRRMAGCYLNREDFESRLRVLRKSGCA